MALSAAKIASLNVRINLEYIEGEDVDLLTSKINTVVEQSIESSKYCLNDGKQKAGVVMSSGNLEKYGIPESLPPKGRRTIQSLMLRLGLRFSIKKREGLAVENSLRYFPEKWHKELATEFLEELDSLGHIYMHRFRPDHEIRSRSIHEYEV